jgi:hypothetical protein
MLHLDAAVDSGMSKYSHQGVDYAETYDAAEMLQRKGRVGRFKDGKYYKLKESEEGVRIQYPDMELYMLFYETFFQRAVGYRPTRGWAYACSRPHIFFQQGERECSTH